VRVCVCACVRVCVCACVRVCAWRTALIRGHTHAQASMGERERLLMDDCCARCVQVSMDERQPIQYDRRLPRNAKSKQHLLSRIHSIESTLQVRPRPSSLPPSLPPSLSSPFLPPTLQRPSIHPAIRVCVCVCVCVFVCAPSIYPPSVQYIY
jgi:hypothetical protein